ncbi:hypothetical protein Adt_22843 [Abeliophyllum distichum]|uniref:Uncharacterized protein n=1 Tax=Abeliophyllum distichum TaxID=126358 RepID=A0ABD1SA76_9LAMI
MSGFHFFSVPKFKIRRGGVVGDASFAPFVSSPASTPGTAVRNVLKVTVENSFPNPTGRLYPDVLEELPPAVRQATVSVYRCWPPYFGKAVAGAELTELVRLAELHTSWSHVLNCEVYKMLSMKIEELHSTVERSEDVEALRAENKDL